MMRACKVLKGGLQDVADDLGVSLRFQIVSGLAVLRLTGYADRALSPSRLRLVTHCIDLLQDARVVLQ